MHFLKTKTGKECEIIKVSQSGFSSKDVVIWEMTCGQVLEDSEIRDIIEQEFPSAGYGESFFTRITRLADSARERVRVSSFASCE